jgi:hypothetical protein
VHHPPTSLRTLTQHKRSATITVDAAYLVGVLHAARAGGGVALLADVGPTPDGLRRVCEPPPVDPQPMHVRARAQAPARLTTAVATAVSETLAPSEPSDRGHQPTVWILRLVGQVRAPLVRLDPIYSDVTASSVLWSEH